jgi:hypothetical protein
MSGHVSINDTAGKGFVSIDDTVRFPRRQAANSGPALFRPGTNEGDVLIKLLLFCEVKETQDADTKIYFSTEKQETA